MATAVEPKSFEPTTSLHPIAVSAEPRVSGAPLDPRLARVIAFASDQKGEILDAHRLAAVAGMSYAHFLRSFRSATGETIGSFVRRLRLSRAAERLRVDGDTVARIAQDAGYSSQATFTRAFSAAFGCTPSAYRERSSPGRRRTGKYPKEEQFTKGD